MYMYDAFYANSYHDTIIIIIRIIAFPVFKSYDSQS